MPGSSIDKGDADGELQPPDSPDSFYEDVYGGADDADDDKDKQVIARENTTAAVVYRGTGSGAALKHLIESSAASKTTLTRVSGLEGSLKGLEGLFSQIRIDFTGVRKDVNDHTESLTSLQSSIKGVNDRTHVLEDAQKVEKKRLRILDANKAAEGGNGPVASEKRLAEVKKGNATTENALNKHIHENNARLQRMDGSTTGLATRVGTLEGQMTAMQGEMGTMRGEMRTMQGQLAQILNHLRLSSNPTYPYMSGPNPYSGGPPGPYGGAPHYSYGNGAGHY